MTLHVLCQGVMVLGAYTSLDRLKRELPADVELIPCPNPAKGWNTNVNHLRVRIVEVDEPAQVVLGGTRPGEARR